MEVSLTIVPLYRYERRTCRATVDGVENSLDATGIGQNSNRWVGVYNKLGHLSHSLPWAACVYRSASVVAPSFQSRPTRIAPLEKKQSAQSTKCGTVVGMTLDLLMR